MNISFSNEVVTTVKNMLRNINFPDEDQYFNGSVTYNKVRIHPAIAISGMNQKINAAVCKIDKPFIFPGHLSLSTNCSQILWKFNF